MNTRTVVTLVIAGILVLIVMGVALAWTVLGNAQAEKYALAETWDFAFNNAQSMQIIDLTGDGQDDLFLQNEAEIYILDSAGQVVYQGGFTSPVSTTMGDVDGDGVEDVVIFESGSPAPSLLLLSRGEVRWEVPVEAFEDPSRTAVVRFAEGTQVIVGDIWGNLAAFSPEGSLLWQSQLSALDYIRGLDDIKVNGQTLLAAANHDGSVAVLNSQGQPLWQSSLGGTLRRMRAYDLDGDGSGEMVTGGENNVFRIFDAASGSVEVEFPTGQTITEIREAEIDGDPASREVILGGKDGGVWALSARGDQLWSAAVGEKVNEIALVDVDKDGQEEVVIGDDGGGVVLFTPQGTRFGLDNRSAILRIDVGTLDGERKIAIADNTSVRVVSLTHSELPGFRFSPLLAGLAISAVILLTAWIVATIPAKPAQRLNLQSESVESLLAHRRMLKESIADVDRLKSAGEMTSQAYLLRLKELRELLAENETALRKAGAKIEIETFNCPHCGGKLQLGVDRCDYCGQVLLS